MVKWENETFPLNHTATASDGKLGERPGNVQFSQQEVCFRNKGGLGRDFISETVQGRPIGRSTLISPTKLLE